MENWVEVIFKCVVIGYDVKEIAFDESRIFSRNEVAMKSLFHIIFVRNVYTVLMYLLFILLNVKIYNIHMFDSWTFVGSGTEMLVTHYT